MARQREQRLLVRVGNLVMALPPPEAILAPPAQVVAKPGALPDERAFRHHADTLTLVDLRSKLGVAAEGGQVLLARAGGELRGFMVDEVIGPAPPWAKSAALPPGLPVRTFSGAWVYRERMVLLSDFDALHALTGADPALRKLAQSAPTSARITGKQHVPLDEALGQVAAAVRDAAGKRPAAPGKPAAATQPSSAGFAATQQVRPDRDAPGTPPVQSSAARMKAPALARAFIRPVVATAAVIALVVVALPFVTKPQRERPPAAAPVAETVPLPPAAPPPLAQRQVKPPAPKAPGRVTPPPRPARANPKRQQHDAPPRPEAPGQAAKTVPETAPSITLTIEPAERGVTLVVERAEAPKGREVPERVMVHTVVDGDTLWDIAKRYLDDPFAYDRLASDSRIHDPDLIHAGDKIRIVVREVKR